jgi:hypothetical protein
LFVSDGHFTCAEPIICRETGATRVTIGNDIIDDVHI